MSYSSKANVGFYRTNSIGSSRAPNKSFQSTAIAAAEFKRYTSQVSMKLNGLILIIAVLFIPKTTLASSLETNFWEWFQNNENVLFHFERDQESIFNELAIQMSKVNSDLTFEFGPVENGSHREFVISAGGIKASFPAVESLYSSAPVMKNWTFIKYRPRRNPINDIEYGDVAISVEDVHYKMFKDKSKLGIIVFLKGYSKEQHNTYGNIGFLFLDGALGEFDIETKVGFIEFHGRDSKYFEGSLPLKELANNFDDYFDRH